MTSLIKAMAWNQAAVHSFPAMSGQTQDVKPTNDAAADAALALQADIEALKAELEDVRRKADDELNSAREAGRRAAHEEFAGKEAARAEALGKGIALAQQAFEERLGALEGLAPAIAHAALARLIEGVDHADFVSRAVGLQLRTLRREAIVAIRVSRADFPDDASLAGIPGSGSSPAILADADLSTGECRIDLRLGHVDLGVRSQWREASALLSQLAEGEVVE